MKSIPAAILTFIVGLLHPFLPGLTEPVLLQALQAIGGTPATASDPAARRMLSLREAGRALNLSEWTVRRMALRGQIEAHKIGSLWRVPVSVVEELARPRPPAQGVVS